MTPKLAAAIENTRRREAALAAELRRVGHDHESERDIANLASVMTDQASTRLDKLGPPGTADGQAERAPTMVLLGDLCRLFVEAQASEIHWVILGQAAQAARDEQLLNLATRSQEELARLSKWLKTRIKEAAPQGVTVP